MHYKKPLKIFYPFPFTSPTFLKQCWCFSWIEKQHPTQPGSAGGIERGREHACAKGCLKLGGCAKPSFLVLFQCLNENTSFRIAQENEITGNSYCRHGYFFPPFSKTCFTELEKLLLRSDMISEVPVERSACRYSAKSGGDDKDHASSSQQLSRAS